MATQYDPIAKDGSLNTTEATPRNIADVLAEELRGIASVLTPAQLNSLSDVTISSPSDGQTLKYDAVTQKWINANDAGGHTIENPSGTDMTQRANLQFADAHLTDDSVNDRTEVEVIEEVDENGWASATEDGLYHVDDNGSAFVPITGNEIAYDSNTSVNEKIDELDEAVNRGSVSVSADGVKTYSQLLDELFALVDMTKLSDRSIFVVATTGGGLSCFNILGKTTTQLTFGTSSNISQNGGVSSTVARLQASGSEYLAAIISPNSSVSIVNAGANITSIGTGLYIRY